MRIGHYAGFAGANSRGGIERRELVRQDLRDLVAGVNIDQDEMRWTPPVGQEMGGLKRERRQLIFSGYAARRTLPQATTFSSQIESLAPPEYSIAILAILVD